MMKIILMKGKQTSNINLSTGRKKKKKKKFFLKTYITEPTVLKNEFPWHPKMTILKHCQIFLYAEAAIFSSRAAITPRMNLANFGFYLSCRRNYSGFPGVPVCIGSSDTSVQCKGGICNAQEPFCFLSKEH